MSLLFILVIFPINHLAPKNFKVFSLFEDRIWFNPDFVQTKFSLFLLTETVFEKKCYAFYKKNHKNYWYSRRCRIHTDTQIIFDPCAARRFNVKYEIKREKSASVGLISMFYAQIIYLRGCLFSFRSPKFLCKFINTVGFCWRQSWEFSCRAAFGHENKRKLRTTCLQNKKNIYFTSSFNI